jgi:hypothetical protein
MPAPTASADSSAAATAAAPPPYGTDRELGRRMQQSLGALLDCVRGSREVLPHLCALERGLGEHGTAAVQRVSIPALARICSQLSSLPLPAGDRPLAQLQTLLLDTLDDRCPQVNERTVVLPPGSMHVAEVSHTDFERAARELATTQRDDSLD